MGSVITVDHVSMKFHINSNRANSLKEWTVSKLTRKLRYKDFYALKDVSFSVEKGEVIGIVGQNGSGKSTLLKIISGIYRPTEGTCRVIGRIAPMLELGSGLDYEMSGRDNIFLDGAILGYSEQFLKSKYDEIVDFSEIGSFIDQPLKTYSSGMVTRLAFAIASVVEPEILIVDEILSVGDEHFQIKSGERMRKLMYGGATVLMVSHSMEQIRTMCTRVVWVHNGEIRMIGDPHEVCDAYVRFSNSQGT